MIVDPSERWASELRAQLESLGLQVVAWQTRGTGWSEGLKGSALRWLFVEDQLPSRTGLKCMEKIQEARGFDGRIVFMHSLQGPHASQVETQAYAWGASFVLRKPFRLSEIRKIIEQGTPRSS